MIWIRSVYRVYLLEKLVNELGKPIEETLVFSDVTVYPEYEVNIDLNLEKNDINGWSIIFRFNNTDEKILGWRIPGVLLHAKSTKLQCCTGLDDNRIFVWNSDEMPMNKWFKLTIKQSEFRAVNGPKASSKYIYEILIDGELMFQTINKNPQTYKNTNGTIGKDRGMHPKSKGRYRNFEFKSAANWKHCFINYPSKLYMTKVLPWSSLPRTTLNHLHPSFLYPSHRVHSKRKGGRWWEEYFMSRDHEPTWIGN